MGTNLFAMMIILALIGLIVVYLMNILEQNQKSEASAQDRLVEFTIAASPLKAPKSWMTSRIETDESAYSAVDLVLPITIENAKLKVQTTLLASSKAAPSAYLLDNLYIHKFKDVPSTQAYGLIAKQLADEEGYEGETVWYDALSANPFVTKCLKEKLTPKQGDNCVTTLLVNKRVAALIRFEEKLLPHWRAFHAALKTKLAELNAN